MKRSTFIIAALLSAVGVCGCGSEPINWYTTNNYLDGGTTTIIETSDSSTTTTIIVESDSGVPEASLPNKVRTVYCTATVTPTYANAMEVVDGGVVSPLNLTYTETDFDDGSVAMTSSVAGWVEGPYSSASYAPDECATNTGGNADNECQSATFVTSGAMQQAINSTFWTPAQGGTPSLTTPFKVYPVASQLVVSVNTYPLNLSTNALPTNVSNGYFYYDASGLAHSGTYQVPGMWTLSVDRGFANFTAIYQDPDVNAAGQETFSSPTSSSCIISLVDAGG
jgi:hypothetical protein